MKILVLHQPFPMGNYRLMPYIAHRLKIQGHEPILVEQLNGKSFSQDTVDQLNSLQFDAAYFEMLDGPSFQLLEQSNIKKKVLCYASKGIFNSFEEIIQYRDRYFTSIITNSKEMSNLFSLNNIPNEFFEYYPAPLLDEELTYDSRYNISFVYLGGGYQRLTKPEYKLESEIIYQNPNVAKFGAGWIDVPNYNGILPPDDIGKLYKSAKISLGTIEPSQRKMGMVNNRFSEMMKSGASIAAVNYDNVDYYGGEEFISFICSREELEEVQPLSSSKKKLQNKFIREKEVNFFKSLDNLLSL